MRISPPTSPGRVSRLAGALKAEPIRLLRPSPAQNVIAPGPVPFEAVEGIHDRRMVTLVAWQRYPELMQRLGYADTSQLKAG